MKFLATLILTAIVGIIAACIGSFLGGFFFMLVWNAVMPDVFHMPELGFIQSVCIVFLIGFFKSSSSSSSKE